MVKLRHDWLLGVPDQRVATRADSIRGWRSLCNVRRRHRWCGGQPCAAVSIGQHHGVMTDNREPFDAASFVDRLQRSTAEHVLVVQRRPSGAELAESLTEAAKLLYEWVENLRLGACAARSINPRQTYAWLPLEGSLASSDRAASQSLVDAYVADRSPTSMQWLETNPTRNPTDWALDYLTRCFHTVVDNLAGIAVLVEKSDHLRAPITLSRSALEAAAMACFITDGTVGHRERLRRTLNLHMAQIKEAANERRGSPDRADYDHQLDELCSFAQHGAGFALGRYKSSDVGPPRISPLHGRHDSATSIIERLLPGIGTSMWRSMSAVAHSRSSQFPIPDEYTLPHELKPWQRVESVAWHAMPSILMVRELGLHLEGYLDWDFQRWPSLWEAMVSHWYIAAGLDDARIRRELGLDPIDGGSLVD